MPSGDTEVVLDQIVKYTCNANDTGNPAATAFEWSFSQESEEKWQCSDSTSATYTCTVTNDCSATVSCAARNTAGLSEWGSINVDVTAGKFD